MKTILKVFLGLVAAFAATRLSAQTRPAEELAPSTQPADSAATRPADRIAPPQPAEWQGWAGRSLRRSAVALVQGAGQASPNRRRRLVDLLSRYALRVDPNHPETLWLRANVLEADGHPAEAAAVLERLLAHRPADFPQRLRWLRLRLEPLQTADQRLALLSQLLDAGELPEAVLAEVAVEKADIFRGKGLADDARKAYDRALQLDPLHPEALSGRLTLMDKLTPLDRIRTHLLILRGNPADLDSTVRLGEWLGRVGAYEQAVRFTEHALALVDAQGADLRGRHDLMLAHVNALLDAEEFTRVAQVATAEPGLIGASGDLKALAAEAYQRLGQAERARRLVQSLEMSIRPADANQALSARRAAELAWFYLRIRPDATKALDYARQAAEEDPNARGIQRILGAAELRSGLADAGVGRLKPLAEEDPWAALFLARYYGQVGRSTAMRELVREALAGDRSGAAARQLRLLARQRAVDVPENPATEEARTLAGGFSDAHFQLALEPERSIEIDLKPARTQIPVGSPLHVRATLRNVGALPLPLGPYGLFRPAMAPRVVMGTGVGMGRRAFADLPLVAWPAPRYLEPGQSVKQTVDLEPGPLGRYLLTRPLWTVGLSVLGMLDPLAAGGEVYSSLPAVRPVPHPVTRTDLLGGLGELDPNQRRDAYRTALGRLVYDIKKGDLTDRLAAARKTAGLVAACTRYQKRLSQPPEGLTIKDLDRGMPLRLMVELLNDPEPVVRAEMLAALAVMDVDAGVARWFQPVHNDPAALVRFRLAERLGDADLAEGKDLLTRLAQDADPLVRGMARVYVDVED